MTFTTTICDKYDNEIEVTVEYTFYPAYYGQRDSLGGIKGAGPPLEPDEPADIEILSVTKCGCACNIIDLIFDEFPQYEIEHLYEACWQDLAERNEEEAYADRTWRRECDRYV